MNARTRQKVVFIALPVAMIWGAYNLFWTEKKTVPPAQPEIAGQAVMTPETPTFARGSSDLERVKEADWGPDPFRSVIKRPSKPADKPREELKLILSGIVFNEKSPMAVINKKTVRVGDTVGSAQVVSIDRRTVLMERRGKQFRLKVTKG